MVTSRSKILKQHSHIPQQQIGPADPSQTCWPDTPIYTPPLPNAARISVHWAAGRFFLSCGQLSTFLVGLTGKVGKHLSFSILTIREYPFIIPHDRWPAPLLQRAKAGCHLDPRAQRIVSSLVSTSLRQAFAIHKENG